jgi:hypothetical protein
MREPPLCGAPSLHEQNHGFLGLSVLQRDRAPHLLSVAVDLPVFYANRFVAEESDWKASPMTESTIESGDGKTRSPMLACQFSLHWLFQLTFLIALTLGVVEWIEAFPRAGILAVIGWTVALNRL